MNWRNPIILGAIAGSGKFEADLEPLTSIKDDIWKLAGIIDGTLILERGEVLQENNTFETEQVEVNDIKLIARPISDMTDEEKLTLHKIVKGYKVSSWEKAVNDHEREETQWSGYLYDTDWENNLLEKLSYDRGGFLYLLSIGVLPKYLATEDVIFKNKNNV